MSPKLPLIATLAASISMAFAATPAFAKEGDVAACEGKADGDACSRLDGDPGTCQPDESDPNVLTCDDDATGSGGSSSGCSASASGGAMPGVGLGLGLAALGLISLRRRARRAGR